MAIKEILEFIGQENIADDLKPDVLADLGQEVKRSEGGEVEILPHFPAVPSSRQGYQYRSVCRCAV